ncbi:DEAD/DEAH box helicase [Microbacterium sp. STN6]|uniref:DNA glycosylase AlkZ-like family protein n=1 Tax=Microbacterium sp. STN6 TaxID=2995588 RepID=UPI002260E7C2|nr:crosslink repair DNA glycosylase YcaQ family protein [Microbacterium sp. STN6]MCX7523127.1 DEAD/DEAH box helicase [Microbacterium sp. STN6]
MSDGLEQFSPATRQWFRGAFAAPTEAQRGAWQAISSGSHALVIAPTGSGKTLAAFLWAIDRLAASAGTVKRGESRDDSAVMRTRVLYISPLKALGVDVERNLRSPLVGVTQTARLLGSEPPAITVGVRSGDTPAADRRALLKSPPDILITTPESLFLMLTSAARETLRGVETVIVDEVHAVAATKRGSHLAVSLERLDALLARPAQRIGLSATVRPAEEVARFLGGRAPVEIVAPTATKRFDLRVVVPVEDMSELGAQTTDGDGERTSGSIWPHVEEAITDRILQHRSTIVFANSRRLAERLTSRLNEIYAGRLAWGSTEPPHDSAPVAGSGEHSRDPKMVGGTRKEGSGERTWGPGTQTGPAATATRAPAEMMGGSGQSGGSNPDAPILARAHHGSVSKEQRAQIEDDLKTGRLRCVVATSSLELGIDMGEVDLVVQVESPPSVASGLQRVGRAGHQVGEVSRGVLFPKHRADLVHTTVAAERMVAGLIEQLAVPANPLDILAQQTIAAVALDEVDADEWFDTVRRSAPFATLPRSAFDATLDLLAGRYPSDEFAELRPRIVWDRDTGTLTGRPGAQRLAVTSGGTIPDRGLFGVFMIGGEGAASGGRVGELDEEMVYESRVGDVFALGATSWRIQEITHDRVLVTPAFGEPGRLPFWKGDSQGRPAELGAAIGAFLREVSGAGESEGIARCEAAGLDERASANLLAFVAEQKEATGHVPTDRTLVVERVRDELGDWRVILHSPYGMQVHSPWALAVGARVRERFGLDGSCVASDDGIIVRIPDTEAEPPGAELFVFAPEELEAVVTAEVGGSALFASRFRECAARALLLPKYNPGKRSPLWQQRQKASQLLDVARKYPSFPIILETVRECLRDVYDLPGLIALARQLGERRIRITETTTQTASPFARTLLFGYVAAFMYEGDNPLAERRATALTLDAGMLAELLGRVELRELLDPAIIDTVESELQRLAPERRMRADAEGAADLLRILGPLTSAEVAARLAPAASPAGRATSGSERVETAQTDLDTAAAPPPQSAEEATALLDGLVAARRALRVGIAGDERYAAIEDAARLRDALGTPLPIGVPVAFIEPVDDPLGDLVSRYARTHGPFTTADAAARLGLGVAVVAAALRRLAHERRVVEGEFRAEAQGSEWCDAEVLRRIRRLSLAALRHEVEPVEPQTLGRFLPAWQHVGGSLRGIDGVASVIEQLAGARIPASAWESLVLPSRVAGYSPAMLDELTATGEVVWAGAGALPGRDGWVTLHLAETAPLTLPLPTEHDTDELQREILVALGAGGGFFFRQLSDAVGSTDDDALVTALWDLAWAGLVTNDTFAPLRALTGTGGGAHKRRAAPPRSRLYRGRGYSRPTMPTRVGPPTAGGRWSILPVAETDGTVRAHAHAETLLERYGVVTRGAVMNEGEPGGFALAYKVLTGFEESGRSRRGYFVETLGAAQFATAATVDRLRSFAAESTNRGSGADHDGTGTGPGSTGLGAIALAATDPANPYGAALPWPSETATGHRPGRKAGALVVLVNGALALYVERGGKTVLTFADDPASYAAAAHALARLITLKHVDRLTIETIDGEFAIGTALGDALEVAGFAAIPRGLRMRR